MLRSFTICHDPADDVVDRTSTDETQSSCSKEAMKDGGIRARTYSTVNVVSADIPFAVRYSSIEVRRYEPLIRNSRGTGRSVSKRLFTRVESAYRLRDVGTNIGPVESGRERSASFVVNCRRIWDPAVDSETPTCAMLDSCDDQSRQNGINFSSWPRFQICPAVKKSQVCKNLRKP